jgi:hypothetical protein
MCLVVPKSGKSHKSRRTRTTVCTRVDVYQIAGTQIPAPGPVMLSQQHYQPSVALSIRSVVPSQAGSRTIYQSGRYPPAPSVRSDRSVRRVDGSYPGLLLAAPSQSPRQGNRHPAPPSSAGSSRTRASSRGVRRLPQSIQGDGYPPTLQRWQEEEDDRSRAMSGRSMGPRSVAPRSISGRSGNPSLYRTPDGRQFTRDTGQEVVQGV